MLNHAGETDYHDVINEDRNNVWHHLVQHSPFEASDPMVVVVRSATVAAADGQRLRRAPTCIDACS